VTSAGGFSAPQPLSASHDVGEFSCGNPSLDSWLRDHAMQSQQAGLSRTLVVCSDRRVVGFFSLAAGSVAREDAPDRVVKGLPRHRVPVIVLTRMAVDVSAQRGGLGSEMLRYALFKVVEVSETIGVRALLIHAKDEQAKRWYLERGEFEEAPLGSLQLFLLMKDLRRAIRGGG